MTLDELLGLDPNNLGAPRPTYRRAIRATDDELREMGYAPISQRCVVRVQRCLVCNTEWRGHERPMATYAIGTLKRTVPTNNLPLRNLPVETLELDETIVYCTACASRIDEKIVEFINIHLAGGHAQLDWIDNINEEILHE